jgi:hypothetical protein
MSADQREDLLLAFREGFHARLVLRIYTTGIIYSETARSGAKFGRNPVSGGIGGSRSVKKAIHFAPFRKLVGWESW